MVKWPAKCQVVGTQQLLLKIFAIRIQVHLYSWSFRLIPIRKTKNLDMLRAKVETSTYQTIDKPPNTLDRRIWKQNRCVWVPYMSEENKTQLLLQHIIQRPKILHTKKRLCVFDEKFVRSLIVDKLWMQIFTVSKWIFNWKVTRKSVI